MSADARILRINLRTIDRLTDRRLEVLRKVLEIANETSSAVEFYSTVDQNDQLEQLESNSENRNHRVENQIIEIANEQLAVANTHALSSQENSQLEAIGDQHHAHLRSRILSEKQRRESISRWIVEITQTGIKVVIRLMGIPL